MHMIWMLITINAVIKEYKHLGLAGRKMYQLNCVFCIFLYAATSQHVLFFPISQKFAN